MAVLSGVGQSLDERAEALGELGVVDPLEAVGGDRGHDRVDAPDEVGAAGGGVLVGRLEQRRDGQVDGVVAARGRRGSRA